jgi:HlyD family secretion protein
MSANAEIILEEHDEALVIPEAALVYDTERNTFVELFDSSEEDLTRRVAVETGISNGTSTEILSGLEEGDRVVAEPDATQGILG